MTCAQVEKKPVPEESPGAGGSGTGRKLSRKQEKAPEEQEPHDSSVNDGEPTVPAASITSPTKDATTAADGEAEIGKPGPAPTESAETEATAPAGTLGGASGSTSGGFVSKFKELIAT